jgi:heat shock protein HtpX
MVSFGQRAGHSLAAEIKRHGARRPRLTPSTALAYLISVGVYGLCIVLAWQGISALAGGSIHPVKFMFIVITLALAVSILPRPRRMPADVLARDDLPALFTFVDGLADLLGSPRIHGVVVDEALNASYGRYGLLHRRVLTIGLPLYWALDSQMRVAILGHELGHGINGDPVRAIVVGDAYNGLVRLHQILEPEELAPSELGFAGYLAIPLTLLMLGLSRLALALAYLLLLLVQRSGQRAEYYSDAIGVRAGGKAATLGALERLQAIVMAGRLIWINDVADPIAKVSQMIRTIPPRELERIRRVERLEGSRLDYSHPPTAYRLEAIEGGPDPEPAYVLSDELAARIDAEFEPYRAPLGRRIVDTYEATISY